MMMYKMYGTTGRIRWMRNLMQTNVYRGGDRHENGREKMYELYGTVV